MKGETERERERMEVICERNRGGEMKGGIGPFVERVLCSRESVQVLMLPCGSWMCCAVLLPCCWCQGLAANFGVMLNAVSAVNAVAIMGLADEYVNYVMRAFELEDGTPVVSAASGVTIDKCLL